MAKQTLTIEVGAKNNTGGVFATISRDVDKLKQRFGSNSLMKNVTDIAVGGGALAGVSFVGRTFADLTKGATEFADKLAEGKTSTVELMAELAKGLPIVGGFAQGIESVLSYATGIGAEIRRITEASRVANAATDFGNNGIQRIIARREGIAVDNGDLNGTLLKAKQYADAQQRAFRTLREEIGMTTEQAARLQKIINVDIREEQARIVGRGVMEPLLNGIGKIITPEAIKRYQDSQKPTIFGFRNPFAGSEDDKRRQADEQARRREAIGVLTPRLQNQLDALRSERMSTLSTLNAGVSVNSSIGISGVKSAGIDSLSSPSSQERNLAAAIKKLEEGQAKRDERAQGALDSIIQELKRGFNLDIPKELRRI